MSSHEPSVLLYEGRLPSLHVLCKKNLPPRLNANAIIAPDAVVTVFILMISNLLSGHCLMF